MQFGVVEVLVCEIDGRVLGGMRFCALEAAFCKSDGRVLAGLQFGCWWRCCFARVTAGC